MDRSLPTVIVVSHDAPWRSAARALVEAAGATVLGELEPASPLVPAGLVLLDNRADVAVSGPVLRVGLDVEQPFDLAHPLDPGAVALALRAVAAALRPNGLLPDALLHAALQRLVSLTSESIEIVDERVRLMFVNPAFEHVTGYELPAVLGRTTGDLFRAGTHDPTFYQGILETLHRGEPWRGQLVARRADGSLSYQESILAPYDGPDGRRAGFVALKRDLARDELLARAVDNLSAQRAALVNEVADAFVLHDDAGRVLDRNAQAATMFFLDARGEASSLLHRVAPADADALRAVWRSLEPGEPAARDVSLRGDSGEPTTVAFRSVRVRVAGEDLVLSLVRDVSDRVALKRSLERRGEELSAALETLRRTTEALVEKEKLAALGGLVAGVAHELNTPLGVAVTATSLINEFISQIQSFGRGEAQLGRKELVSLTDSAQQAARMVSDNVARATRLIQQFKTLALAEEPVRWEPLELHEFLEAVEFHNKTTFQRLGITLTCAGDACTVSSDATALSDVLTQLVQNAGEHAYDLRGGPVHVTVEALPDGGARLHVDDRGPGVPEAERSHLLEPFYTTARGRGQAGLGLHVTHSRVVHTLGGSLTFDHAPGGGFRATVTLPASPPGR